jgi:hypothetical protein
MLRSAAFKPRIENSHRADEWKRCEPFLKWLRGRPCFLSVHAPGKHTCTGKVRACHFDPFGDKGMSTKVSIQRRCRFVTAGTPSRRTFSVGRTSKANTVSTGAMSSPPTGSNGWRAPQWGLLGRGGRKREGDRPVCATQPGARPADREARELHAKLKDGASVFVQLWSSAQHGSAPQVFRGPQQRRRGDRRMDFDRGFAVRDIQGAQARLAQGQPGRWERGLHPDSMAVASMPKAEFERLYEDTMKWLTDRYGCDPEMLTQEAA